MAILRPRGGGGSGGGTDTTSRVVDDEPDSDPPTTTSNDLRITSGGSSSSASSSTSSSSSSSSEDTTTVSVDVEPPTSDDPVPGLGSELDDSDDDGTADVVERPTDSNTSSDSSTSSDGEYTTMNSDPFSGGRTGSEVMAEAGDPSSVVTSDPNADSLQDKIAQDGLASTVGTFTGLAQDGNDSNSGPTFDQIPDTEAGRQTLQNTANTFVEAAQNVANSATGTNGQQTQNPAQGIQQAFSEADGMGKGLLAAVALAFAFGLLAVAGGS